MAETERQTEPRARTRERARIAKADRENQAMMLRRQGIPYRQIARILDCSTAAAHGMVQRHVRNMPLESATELRAHLLARLDDVYRQNADRLTTPANAMVCIRATEATAKMCGVNIEQPAGGQVTGFDLTIVDGRLPVTMDRMMLTGGTIVNEADIVGDL